MDSRDTSFEPYNSFLYELEGLSKAVNIQGIEQDIEHAINGKAYSSLRTLISLDVRRKQGAFFTSEELGAELVGLIPDSIGLDKTVLDPCCGAGNLLIAYAHNLPIKASLKETVDAWGEVIFGSDVSGELVAVTKLRLALLAKHLGQFSESIDPADSIFPKIVKSDALTQTSVYGQVDYILLNPPYQSISCPSWCQWGTGKCSAAAVFVDHISQNIGRHTKVFSVLPEVLRCGTRYAKFRGQMSETVRTGHVKKVGVFDPWTDIDVFISEFSVLGETSSDNFLPDPAHELSSTVDDYFNVRVGPLVAYRSPMSGNLRPYLETKTTPAWSRNHTCKNTRRFSGTVFKPPFVVIRRTSRPGDKFRAIGTIIRGNEPVAVENHLIVACPKDGTVKQCLNLLRVLKNEQTNAYLDDAMCCRHLTVKAVKNIPWCIDG